MEHASIPFSHDESIDPNFCLALLPFACLDASPNHVYVNMECAPSFDEVFVTGPWCGWCGNYGDNALYDEDGDGICSVAIDGLEDLVEYKYAIDGFANQEWLVDNVYTTRAV